MICYQDAARDATMIGAVSVFRIVERRKTAFERWSPNDGHCAGVGAVGGQEFVLSAAQKERTVAGLAIECA